MGVARKFSRFLAWSLVVFQGLSLALVMGALYQSLARSMEREFYGGLRVQQAEVELVLRERFHQLRVLLRDLSRDNGVRVTLMLGVRSQLEEMVQRVSPPHGGAMFFVMDQEWGEFAPDIPASLQDLRGPMGRMAMAEPTDAFEHPRGEEGRFLAVGAQPIKRGEERLGAAFMVYDLSQDMELWHRLRLRHQIRLLLRAGDNYWDLYGGRATGLPAPGHEEAWLPLKDFPDLVFAAPTKALVEKKRGLVADLALLALAIFVMTLLLSVFIARRVSRSLGLMARQAGEISQNPQGRSMRQDELGYREFQDLAGAFNQVLGSLHQAQAEIKRRGQQELDASQRRYRALVQTSPTGILSLDERGKVIFANRAFEEMSGFDQEEILGLTPGEMMSMAEGADSPREWGGRLGGGGGRWRFESRLRRKEGAPILVEAWMAREPGQQSPQYLLNVVDISEREKVRRTLKEEQDRLAAILDGNPIPTFVIDGIHRVVLWNRACEALTGMAKERALGRPVDSTVFYPGQRRPVLADLVLEMDDARMLKLYGDKGLSRHPAIPEAFQASDQLMVKGPPLHVYFLAARLRDSQGQVIGAIETVQDVTERDNLERQLRHAQKMEAVGTLSGGMAHEFNNILAAIQGYTRLLVMGLKTGRDVEGYAREIDRGCRRAAGLTRKMLTFSRLDVGEKVPVDVNRTVAEVRDLLRQTLPPQIELVMESGHDLPLVLAEPTQLEQVLLNLGVNARDAMPQGGVVTFSTALMEPDAAFRRANPWAAEARYVVITVADQGQGMPPEVAERIFEPFFTTKEPGKGTGLGLSIAYSIVTGFGGSIAVDSRPGQGTAFRLYLPAVEGKALALPRAREEAIPGQGRGERVLVVDDEPQLREITREILLSGGYEVGLAADGRQALEIYRQAREEGRPFDLVVMDLAMPVMDGEACLDQLIEADPGARVIIATGYGGDNLDRGELKRKARAILPKPFDLRMLLREVRAALDS